MSPAQLDDLPPPQPAPRRPTPPSTHLGSPILPMATAARRRQARTAAIPQPPRAPGTAFPASHVAIIRRGPRCAERAQDQEEGRRRWFQSPHQRQVGRAPGLGPPHHAPAAACVDHRRRLRYLRSLHLHAPEVPQVPQAALPHGGACYLGLPAVLGRLLRVSRIQPRRFPRPGQVAGGGPHKGRERCLGSTHLLCGHHDPALRRSTGAALGQLTPRAAGRGLDGHPPGAAPGTA